MHMLMILSPKNGVCLFASVWQSQSSSMRFSITVNHRLIWLADCQRGLTDILSSVDNGIATCEQSHGFCSESATVVQKGIKGKRPLNQSVLSVDQVVSMYAGLLGLLTLFAIPHYCFQPPHLVWSHQYLFGHHCSPFELPQLDTTTDIGPNYQATMSNGRAWTRKSGRP